VKKRGIGKDKGERLTDPGKGTPPDKILKDVLLPKVKPFSVFTSDDIEQYKEGKNYHLFRLLGSKPMEADGEEGTYFAVWAPNAETVHVSGSFNSFDQLSHMLYPRWDSSGVWEGFIPGIKQGADYKYHIHSKTGEVMEKADPFGNYAQTRPATSSIVWDLEYSWHDGSWMKRRKNHNALNKPVSIYEVHLGSWKRDPEDPSRFLNYREIAQLLPGYCHDLGFTHVEFLPVMEHPFDGSWGYQVTGYFAPTSRFGTPQDLMFLVDTLHQNGIGVIFDWVPSHFPYDAHGLYRFDGTHLYEHEDMRKGYQPDWKSYIFNTGRNEVKAFLISSALFWMEYYHADGLRVDAVASMLYLDYSRKEGEWLPNENGGNENLENIRFFKELNETIYAHFPDVQVIAEESSTYPGVTKPAYLNGLGFGMKWMMGWMNDTLRFFNRDPVHRKWHLDEFTFSFMYAFSENFLLPLSHDEMVHGKYSLVNKMPGDEWQRFANLRLMFLYMWSHPGAKLIFMGSEFGQLAEWNFEKALDWHLLDLDYHKGIQKLIRDLNYIYRTEKALYEYSFSAEGFEWISGEDYDNSVVCFMRKGKFKKDTLIIVLNMTPVVHYEYMVGVPFPGIYTELINSDNLKYAGSDVLNGKITAENSGHHNKKHSIKITLPPLGGVIFKKEI
jgi:1,4-alpha-glucan branching enzyme